MARDRETLSRLLDLDVHFFSPAYAEPVVGRDVVTRSWRPPAACTPTCGSTSRRRMAPIQ